MPGLIGLFQVHLRVPVHPVAGQRGNVPAPLDKALGEPRHLPGTDHAVGMEKVIDYEDSFVHVNLAFFLDSLMLFLWDGSRFGPISTDAVGRGFISLLHHSLMILHDKACLWRHLPSFFQNPSINEPVPFQ